MYINPVPSNLLPASWPAFCFGLAARRRLESLHRPLPCGSSSCSSPCPLLCRCHAQLYISVPFPGYSFSLLSCFLACLCVCFLVCLVAEVRDLQIYYLFGRVMQNCMVLSVVSFSSVSTVGLDYKKLVLANIDFPRLYYTLVFKAFRGSQWDAKIIQICWNNIGNSYGVQPALNLDSHGFHKVLTITL